MDWEDWESSTWLHRLRLVLWFGRFGQTPGVPEMNARQRIHGMMADRAAIPLRIKDGGVAIPGKHHDHLVREQAGVHR